jgi:hypothetical protein
MLMHSRGGMDMIVHYMKNNLSTDEYNAYSKKIAGGMSKLIDISNALHSLHPDIIPKELK